jgi:uncharacterized protein YbaR (Trm112 family)
MNKLHLLNKIREIYLSGGNIIQYLKQTDGRDYNTIEDILISYDFQSGSYIREIGKNPEFINKYCSSISDIIKSCDLYNSILEVGVGEATTLGTLLKYIKIPENVLGFDISWSRLMYAKEFLKDLNHKNVKLFCANLFEIPLMDNAVDIVYTSHSIEPNGGMEEEALKELYRVTNKYLILLEPSYELADEEAKLRMKKHGYITNLYGAAVKLGYNVVTHRLFDYSSNPFNPTGLIMIKKGEEPGESLNTSLVCPVSRTLLKEVNRSFLFSPDSMLAYPVLKKIPCLLNENAIIATHFLTDYKEFKKINKLNFSKDRKK